MSDINDIISEPITGHPEYHIMVGYPIGIVVFVDVFVSGWLSTAANRTHVLLCLGD